MWPRCQLSESAHQSGDDPGGRARRSRWWGRWRDLEQHCLQCLKTGSDEPHGAARVTGHREVLTQHPHLRFRHECLNIHEHFSDTLLFQCKIWQKLKEVWAALGFVQNHREEKQAEFHYHVCVHFFFVVDVGSGPSKLHQFVRLVHHQRGLKLAQPEQVAAEHPAETRERDAANKEQEMKLIL